MGVVANESLLRFRFMHPWRSMSLGRHVSTNRLSFSLRHWHIWAVSFAFWTMYAILDTAGSFAILGLRGQRAPFTDVVAWNFAESYVWVLFTPVIWAFTQQYGFTGKQWKRSLAIHVPLGLLIMVLISWLLLAPMDYLGWGDILTPFRTRLLGLALQDLPRYFVTVAVAQIVLHYKASREHETQSARLEASLAEARLQILRSQIEPHFLFNTLNSIATLATQDPSAAERMTLQLADLLRVSLDYARSQEIPLKQELEFLQNYLDIQRTRFRDRLTVQMNIDPDLLPVRVPSLILQPLAENAIRHGIARSATPGYIRITAARENGHIKIDIADNGAGMCGSPEPRDGVGLSNTRARLEQLYGSQHQFRVEGGDGRGCRVTLVLPLSRSRPQD